MFSVFENIVLNFFCKFLSGEIATVYWEIEAKLLKLFNSKVGPRKRFTKWS